MSAVTASPAATSPRSHRRSYDGSHREDRQQARHPATVCACHGPMLPAPGRAPHPERMTTQCAWRRRIVACRATSATVRGASCAEPVRLADVALAFERVRRLDDRPPRRRPGTSSRRCSRTSRRPPRRSTSTSTGSGRARSASASRRRCSPRRPRACPCRLVVDGSGSYRGRSGREFFARLRAGGIDVGVVRATRLRAPSQLGHFDHRKFLVIDGGVGWIGGAGIEDHFDDGRFHDLFLRLTGPVASQLQLVFLATFRWLGGAGPRGGSSTRSSPVTTTSPARSPRPSCTTRPAATGRSPTRSRACSTTRARRSTSSTRTSPTGG